MWQTRKTAEPKNNESHQVLFLIVQPYVGASPPKLEDLESDAFNLLKATLMKMGIPTLNPDFQSKMAKEMHKKYLNILIMDLKDHVCVKYVKRLLF